MKQRLTAKEEEVMNILWKSGESMFIRDIVAAMPEPRPNYNTVATQVRFLEEKGFVVRRPMANSYQYSVAVSEREYRGQTVGDVVSRYYGNSYTSLVSQFVEEEKMGLDELKALLLLAGFYAFFMLFMRKTTLFRLNRAVLLAGTVACLLLPLVRINVSPSAPVADYLPLRIVLPETVVGGGNVSESATGGWDWKALLYGVYAVGFTVVLISAAVSLGRIRKIIRQYKGVRYCYDGKRYVMLHIVEHDLPSFSFMNHVVISRSDYDGHPEILTHECAHTGHHHSADMLFMSLVCALQWFNPLVWMMRSELRMMHEYEAARPMRPYSNKASMLLNINFCW